MHPQGGPMGNQQPPPRYPPTQGQWPGQRPGGPRPGPPNGPLQRPPMVKKFLTNKKKMQKQYQSYPIYLLYYFKNIKL